VALFSRRVCSVCGATNEHRLIAQHPRVQYQCRNCNAIVEQAKPDERCQDVHAPASDGAGIAPTLLEPIEPAPDGAPDLACNCLAFHALYATPHAPSCPWQPADYGASELASWALRVARALNTAVAPAPTLPPARNGKPTPAPMPAVVPPVAPHVIGPDNPRVATLDCCDETVVALENERDVLSLRASMQAGLAEGYKQRLAATASQLTDLKALSRGREEAHARVREERDAAIARAEAAEREYDMERDDHAEASHAWAKAAGECSAAEQVVAALRDQIERGGCAAAHAGETTYECDAAKPCGLCRLRGRAEAAERRADHNYDVICIRERERDAAVAVNMTLIEETTGGLTAPQLVSLARDFGWGNCAQKPMMVWKHTYTEVEQQIERYARGQRAGYVSGFDALQQQLAEHETLRIERDSARDERNAARRELAATRAATRAAGGHRFESETASEILQLVPDISAEMVRSLTEPARQVVASHTHARLIEISTQLAARDAEIARLRELNRTLAANRQAKDGGGDGE